jgi:TolB-like protein
MRGSTLVSQSCKGVFLSYASEDAAVAARISASLRAADIEVWFDQSELRGGDAWDEKIRRQIRDCALFVPIISAATAARHEGYFRLEWDLADQRSHMIARNRSFIVPVAVDGAATPGNDVPDSFQRVQWTRLPGGECSAAFADRIAGLLAGQVDPSVASPPTQLIAQAAHGALSPPPSSERRKTVVGIATGAALLCVLGYWAVERLLVPKRAAATAVATAEKSIAVLPFADLSEKHDQEYFADGMAEELTDRLAQISELRVISRTSTAQFKDQNEDVRAIGAKLSVANIVEGSVRRSGDELRVDVKLVTAADGTDRWSQRYDRHISDIFKLQDEIATEVILALKARLVDAASPDEARTRSDAAHNLLLEGRFLMERWAQGDAELAISAYQQALREDPNYALAWTELSWAEMWATPQDYNECKKAAVRAIDLNRNSALAHATLGWCESLLGYNWSSADEEFNRAIALEPNNLRALYGKGRLARVLRKNDESLHFYQAVLARDPISTFVFQGLSSTMLAAGRPEDAAQAARKVLELSPNIEWGHRYLAYALLWNRELDAASREIALEPNAALRLSCVALIEQARGNQQAADAALQELLRVTEAATPYLVAQVYGFRGNAQQAVNWLERARDSRSGWFGEVTGDPAFRAIRGDPAFRAYLRRVQLPE